MSGGYWWPELKPGTQPRTFDPDTEFELVDVETAHRMQKELALDFFDFAIREDPTAGERLKQNRYADQGLALDTRNF